MKSWIQRLLPSDRDRKGDYIWSRLTRAEIQAHAVHLVKLDLSLSGCVHSCEIDTHAGVILARVKNGPLLEIHVHAGNAVMPDLIPRTEYLEHDNYYVALALLLDGRPPDFYLLRFAAWKNIASNFSSFAAKPDFSLIRQHNLSQVVCSLAA